MIRERYGCVVKFKDIYTFMDYELNYATIPFSIRKYYGIYINFLLHTLHNRITALYFSTGYYKTLPTIQGVPLTTEPGISLIILTPMKIL